MEKILESLVQEAKALGLKEIEPENEKDRSVFKASGERNVVEKGAELPRGWRFKKAHFLN
jgi:hypothetical protein